ncbi:MAG: GDP-L-fucose synthase [Cytophagales bacterium]|jgi:GDP-L-fucose synthase|nr:GDP-L-fucose synthase [Cytophagales bacterium]MCA6388876.1 GDP-L-fucose synthase [Cytophagales bacterium]MCA6391106.1 GDP-L-fucose synthase [Cytophagales bacterium]MCA6397749.1 GDP-L-fucose synthase [Cytophagales bacterium]MCA6401416.1 GDP-L-fucose synthase [Cytophagales bacterium]
MEKSSKIYVAGHRGMVGSAIVRKLNSEGYTNLVLRTSAELDLRNQNQVESFFATEKPEYVFLAAAKVGGIMANNTYRADFLYDNLMIEINVIHQSYVNKVKKLLFLGSSCIYPKLAPQPLKEEYLLSGYLEETNEPYAIAKIAGIKLCENYRRQFGCDFISAMPTNLYGPNDSYDLNNSHVIPALLKKISDAKNANLSYVEVWGSGNPLREFLHVEDLADACLFLMNKYSGDNFVNIGSGQELSIKNLALTIKSILGFEGELKFDPAKPDGTPRKLMDVSKLKEMGWEHRIDLVSGLKAVLRNGFEKEV